MRTRAILLIVLAAAESPAAIQDESSEPFRRWAIVASRELADSPLIELLTVKLSQLPDLQLVERGAIDAATRELELSAALGPEATGQRLELGRTIGADALFFLLEERRDEERFLRLIISDATAGARLLHEFLAGAAGREEKASDEIIERIAQIRRHYPRGVERIIGVPPFVSQNLTNEHDRLQSQLAHVLESGLIALPGTAVLEVEEARAIQAEHALAGRELQRRAMPLLVEGEFRMSGPAGKADQSVHLTLSLKRGTRELRHVERSCEGVAAAVEFLRADAVAQVLELAGDAARRAIPPERQVAALSARANTFNRLGFIEQAVALRETCVLLKPGDVDQITRLIDVYLSNLIQRIPAGRRVPSFEEKVRDWRPRLAGWRRALELLEGLIRTGRISRFTARSLHSQMAEGMERYAGYIPAADDPYESLPPEERAGLDRELLECSRAHEAFLREVHPLILNLEGPSRDLGYQSWLNDALMYPQYHVKSFDRKFSTEELDYYSHVLTRQIRDDPIFCFRFLRILNDLSTDRDKLDEVGVQAYEAFLAALNGSDRRMARLYGRFAAVLYDYYGKPPEQRPNPAATLKQIELVEIEGAAIVRDETDRRVFERYLNDAKADLRNLLGLDEADASSRRSARRGRRDREPESDPPLGAGEQRELKYERVRFQVRGRSGELLSLEPMRWAGNPGYVAYGGYPHTIVPMGSAGEVFWNNWTVWLHREAGVLDEVSSDQEMAIRDVDWDGEHVWIASLRDGIVVVSPDGRIVARIGEGQGLPPTDGGLSVQPLAAGKVLAAGSFGRFERAWIGIVELREGQARVRVFHEAKRRSSITEARHNTHAGFTVCCIQRYRDALNGGSYSYIVNAKELAQRVLTVDPESEQVQVRDLAEAGRSGPSAKGHFFYVPGGDGLRFADDRLFHATQLGRVFDDGSVWRELFRHDAPVLGLVSHAGHIYIAGKSWARLDPVDFEIERLGAGPWIESTDREALLSMAGSSVHFGLLIWNQKGRFYKVLPDPPPAKAGLERIQVVHDATNEPLADVELEVEGAGGTWTGRTDIAGFCPETPEAGLLGGTLLACKPGFVNRLADLAPEESGQCVIRMKPVVELGGFVMDADSGEPLEGIRVELGYREPERRGRDWTADYRATTDARGRWSVRTFSGIEAPLRLRCCDDPTGSCDKDPAVLNESQMSALREGSYRFDLSLEAVLAVTVVDQADNPVVAGSVQIFGADPGRGRPVSSYSIRDDGFVRISDVPRADVTLVAFSDNHAPAEVALKPRGGRARIRVQLDPPSVFRGRVLDRRSHPVSGANVEVKSWRGIPVKLWKGATDGEGRFVWNSAPADAVTFRIRDGSDHLVTEPIAAAAGEVEILFERKSAAELSGTVVDERSGEPIAAFTVMHSRWMGGATDERLAKSAQQFSEGAFSVPAPEFGQFVIRIEAEGYAPFEERIRRKRDSASALDVKLRRAVVSNVRVELPDGEPAAFATVMVIPAGSPIKLTNGKPWNSDIDKAMTATAEGVVAVPPQAGAYTLCATDRRGYGEITSDALARGERFVLRPWARVEGRCAVCVDHSQPHQMRYSTAGRRKEGSTRLEQSGNVSTDELGRFVLERLAPGEVILERSMPRTRRRTGQEFHDHPVRLTVDAGQSLERTIEREGVFMKGRLVPPAKMKLAEQAPVDGWLRRMPGAEGEGTMAVGYEFEVDAEGRFIIDDVAPGEYELTISVAGFVPHVAMEQDKPRIIRVEAPSSPHERELDIGGAPLGPQEPRGTRRTRGSSLLPPESEGRRPPYATIALAALLIAALILNRVRKARKARGTS